jgi:mannose-6-phosphate isomerase-like protein (cupin superfamily)
MATQNTPKIGDAILKMAYGSKELVIDDNLNLDLSILPLLSEHLSKDLPIETLERFETILKTVLASNLRGKVSGDTARRVAEFQKVIGLLCKYKSYAIKCASPLGYSIFLQNTGEGFSFQRHIEHKTEVFHILDVKPGGYVFICDYKDWQQCYDQDSFASWFAGGADERYERFRFRPQPGDVFTINKLGIVHTVVGCVLEEFATVSTDMVERLHDQNKGVAIPSHFNRNFVREQLAQISMPMTSRAVSNSLKNGARTEDISSLEIPGGTMTPIARTAIMASRYVIEPKQTSDLLIDKDRAASIYITDGTGRVIIADPTEASRTTPPSIPVVAGDLLLIPAGIHYGFVNEGPDFLKLSEQKISFDVAFH